MEKEMLGKILILIVLFGVIMLIIGIYDGNRFVVVENTFYHSKIQKSLKFAMISDLHNRHYGKNNSKVLEELEKANPDMVLIAGDLLTSQPHQSIETTVALMQEMCKRWPVYYAMGNHETKLIQYADDFKHQYEEFIEKTASKNQHVLRNDRVYLEEYNVDICGLELERTYYKRFVKKDLAMEQLHALIGKSHDNAFQILLAHNPVYFEQYAEWGADMVLSGHVHGGIMKLPVLGGVIAPSLHLFPEYDGGIFHKNKSTMLLSRGMGVHSIPLRFFNPAELHIVTVEVTVQR